MPAALDIDRHQVEMLVIGHGVREAARMLGLPESTVGAWSARGRWIADLPKGVPLPPTMVQPLRTPSPVEAYKQALSDRGNKSRLALAKGLGAAADEIAEMPGCAVLANAQEIKAVVGSLSTVHSWDAQSGQARIDLRVTAQAQTIEAEFVTQDVQAEELP